jgi:hypothetical protein
MVDQRMTDALTQKTLMTHFIIRAVGAFIAFIRRVRH